MFRMVSAALLLSFFPLAADERQENIDLFLVVDKSSSMVEEIDAVKEYILTSVVDELIIPGDYVKVIIFYGESHLIVDSRINDPSDTSYLRGVVESLEADGLYTDIGNALDQLRNVSGYTPERMKYMLLITDGKQEAPPESRYYSPDGSFNHEFLENTKVIQKKGWKIHILGIGSETAAQELARELTGTYSIVPDVDDEGTTGTLSAETIKEAAGELLGRVELVLNPILEEPDKDGNANLILTLRNSGYSQAKTIRLSEITLLFDDYSRNILAEPFPFQIGVEEERTFTIPVTLGPLAPGEYQGELFFRFDGGETFIPAFSEIFLKIDGFWSRNLWLIPTALAFILFAVFLVVYLIRIKKRNEDESKETLSE